MRRLWLNRRHIIKRSWQWAGSAYAMIGLAGMLADLDGLIFPELGSWKRVLIGIAILFGVWLFMIIGCCVFYSHTEKIRVLDLSNNHRVYLQYGDLFAKNVICDKHNVPSAPKRNVVIPVNCCFDTIVDDDLVSSMKIHGKAFSTLYNSGKYTPESLNHAIHDNLNLRKIQSKRITAVEKRKGNLERYPIGTVAEITVSDEEKFFLLALTEFDSDLHAYIHNKEDYMNALQRLFEHISSRSQNFPTVLPLIGGGLPEVCESEQVVLEFLLSIIKINRDKINCDLHIVVRNTGKEDISIFDQNFKRKQA